VRQPAGAARTARFAKLEGEGLGPRPNERGFLAEIPGLPRRRLVRDIPGAGKSVGPASGVRPLRGSKPPPTRPGAPPKQNQKSQHPPRPAKFAIRSQISRPPCDRPRERALRRDGGAREFVRQNITIRGTPPRGSATGEIAVLAKTAKVSIPSHHLPAGPVAPPRPRL